jgi:hypothetical protein
MGSGNEGVRIHYFGGWINRLHRCGATVDMKVCVSTTVVDAKFPVCDHPK